MTIVEEPVDLAAPEAEDERRPDADAGRTGTPDARANDDGADTETSPLRHGYVVAAAVLAAAGAAWLVGGVFLGGLFPRLVGLAGVAVGGGLTALSFRMRRPELLQYAVVPVAALVGAILVSPTATGGTANLPALIGDALTSGGLLQPPTPFEPGWRFILVVLLATLTGAAASAAISLDRPSLAVAIPAPLTVAAALIQPEGSELVASAVGALLTVAALALSYGARLAADGATSSGFEARRLARGALMLVGLMAGMAAIAQAGFLFPDTERDEVIPPQRPPVPPAQPDRVLFTVDSKEPGPWRVGTLDSYDGEAFLLPPFDRSRLVAVEEGVDFASAAGRPTHEVSFEIVDVDNRALPVPSSPLRIDGTDTGLDYDPRTQTVVRREGRLQEGLAYTVTAAQSPDGRTLADAPPPDPAIAAEYGEIPPPPNAVVQLLAEAPENGFDRLQFVRQQLYNNVVAAGAGQPVEVTPARAAELLEDGAEATPFEITATEVLLARWAGIPARMGFGYFGGEADGAGLAFRPKHGAAFLEAYFEGSGWVAIVGTPPRAKDSLSDEQRNDDPDVVATDRLGMVLYVPVRLEPLELLYQTIRYWVTVLTPILALAFAALACYPALAKVLRRSRRRRWASAHGLPGQLWYVYSEFRDRLYDLNVGDVRHTPVEFVADFTHDHEHEELAWLVTRAMWGDLRRDLRDTDVEAAEEMARSVHRRVAAAQPVLNRFLAHISRVSLRDPYSDDLPNVWVHLAVRRRIAGRLRPLGRGLRAVPRMLPRLSRRPAAVATALVVVALFAGGCATQDGLDGATASLEFPDPLMPENALGYELVREEDLEGEYAEAGESALVDDGRVFTIHDGAVVQGSIQVVRFKPEVDAQNRSLQRSVESSLGAAGFRTRRFGIVRLRELQLAEQRIVVWFPPDHNVMQLFVLRSEFDRGDALIEAVLRYQQELPAPGIEGITP